MLVLNRINIFSVTGLIAVGHDTPRAQQVGQDYREDEVPVRTKVDQVVLHRRNDPPHEYRELLLYQTDIHFSVWEVIGFLDPPVRSQADLLSLGSEDSTREFLRSETNRLCHEGFSVVKSTVRV